MLLGAMAPLAVAGNVAAQDVQVVRGATIIPGGACAAFEDGIIVIEGDEIAAVGPAASTAVPGDAVVIDAEGQYVIAGLADMHVHLEYFETPAYLGLFVANGVTTVRSMDGRDFMLDWRRQIEAGNLIGPTIYTAGPLLDGDPPARFDNMVVPNAEAAREAVRQQAAAGYDFIKVYSNLAADTYTAILAEAGQQGLPVAGH
ncbi:MAG: amidohydrolase, partial [Gammaproteobacteria bacterium]|nr:amidohydrolase [Gammaproteobacteria bacterium]